MMTGLNTRLKTASRLAMLLMVLLAVGCGYNARYEKQVGQEEMARGEYAAARDRLFEVTQQERYDWEGHYLLGLVYLELDQPTRAETVLRQALAVESDSGERTPLILDAIAQSMYDQNHLDQMHAFLRAQIDRYGTWQDYARQARFLAKGGDIDGAALAYRKAAYFSKNRDEGIYIEMADFYEALGDQPRAVQALKWAYWINPQHTALPERFRRLGLVPGPTLREEPPQPAFPGDRLFPLPGESE